MKRHDKPQLNCTLLSTGKKPISCYRLDDIQDNYSISNVFVGIPYSNDFRPFELALRQQLESLLLWPVLPKDNNDSPNLFCNICYNIHICKYCIFEISNKFNFGGKKQTNFNPNVYYELGFSQALNKICMLISYNEHCISSDLSGFTTNVYSGEDELKRKVQLWIQDNLSKDDKLLFYLNQARIYSLNDKSKSRDNKSCSAFRNNIADILSTLPSRDRAFIAQKFGLIDGNAKTYIEMSEQYGMSVKELREQIADILRKLKKALLTEDIL